MLTLPPAPHLPIARITCHASYLGIYCWGCKRQNPYTPTVLEASTFQLFKIKSLQLIVFRTYAGSYFGKESKFLWTEIKQAFHIHSKNSFFACISHSWLGFCVLVFYIIFYQYFLFQAEIDICTKCEVRRYF
jgi:hypothetical protein